MKDVVYVQDSLSVTNNCFACLQSGEKCTDCQDDFDNSQTNLAHEIVDEGNQIYRRQWVRNSEDISGHDWIAPLVRVNGRVRQEFLEPVVHMEDRTFNPELELMADETVCHGRCRQGGCG